MTDNKVDTSNIEESIFVCNTKDGQPIYLKSTSGLFCVGEAYFETLHNAKRYRKTDLCVGDCILTSGNQFGIITNILQTEPNVAEVTVHLHESNSRIYRSSYLKKISKTSFYELVAVFADYKLMNKEYEKILNDAESRHRIKKNEIDKKYLESLEKAKAETLS